MSFENSTAATHDPKRPQETMLNHDPNTYKLLTPGPLTTSLTVREAMLVDRCTWDDDYKRMTQEIRAELL